MKKFTNIRKLYEQEITIANLPEDKTDDNTTTNDNTSDTQKVEVQINVDQPNQQPQVQQPIDTENKEDVKEESKTTAVSLFSKIFESREMSHIYHLQVNGEQGSHAAHLALGTYYDGINELLDELIETYQGQYGIVDGYDIIDTKDTRTKEKVAYFEEVVEYIKNARRCISEEDTHLHNIVDEIVALLYKTLYKLKFLK